MTEGNLSERAEQRMAELKGRYPNVQSAVMPALYIVQEEAGHIGQQGLEWVSRHLGIPLAHVQELLTFYTMFYRGPVGRYHFQVCRTLSCELRGSRKIVDYLRSRFGLMPGEVSENGMWSYEEVECLGSCGTAPACEINDTYFENISVERLEEIVAILEREKPDLRFSTLADRLKVDSNFALGLEKGDRGV